MKLAVSMGRLVAIVCAVTVTLAVATACGDQSTDKQKLTVLAAASLKSVFGALATQFEKDHPDVDVTITTAGSQELVRNLNQGMKADVLATADTSSMDSSKVAIDGRKNFATNTLVIVTPRDNPAQIRTLADLARPGVKTDLCAADVPCGRTSLQVLTKAGITVRPVSSETSVTGVVTKVSTGQADAGLVYRTDAKAANEKLATVEVPATGSVVNEYPIGRPSSSENPDQANAFIDLVTGPNGRKALSEAGFGAP